MAHRVTKHTNAGFSLVEILVVIAILAIVVALLLPVFGAAKERALDTQEISQLRQLSLAHGLYIGDHDDAEPGSSVPIIAAGYATPNLVRSPLDPFVEGWANERRQGDFERPTNYKDSFVTLKMCAGSQFFPAFRESEAGGWLIAAGPELQKFKADVIFNAKRYKRLTFAGGVVKRTFPVYQRANGVGIFMDMCFSDDEVIPVP